MKVRLGDICEIQSGGTPSRSKQEYWENGTIPWVKISDIKGKFVKSSEELITKLGLTNSSAKIFPSGTILYTIFATLGEVGILATSAATNQAIAGLQLIDDNFLRDYLFYYLLSKKQYVAKIGRGVAQNNINLSILKNFEIQCLNLQEQKSIVEALDKVSEIISLRKQQLTKLDELVKSRFIEMFGDIITNSKNWDIQPLGELCTIVRGGSPRPIEKFLGGDIPLIKIGDATKGDSIYIHSTQEHIIEAGVSKSRFIKAGSLIFANCGVSLGFARITTFDGCIHDGWLAMDDISTHLNKVFLLKSLNQITEHFRKIAPAGTQPNLNTAIMKAYKQVVPPLPLQQQFAAFVEKVDKSKLAVKQSLEKLETLKKSLMQQYFG